jgi:C-terminal processing protease CtpA/Prc
MGVMVAHDDAVSDVRITQVMPNGPADKAGIKIGDVIVEIAGKPVKNKNGFCDTPIEMSAFCGH